MNGADRPGIIMNQQTPAPRTSPAADDGQAARGAATRSAFWSGLAEDYQREHYRHVTVYPALRIRLRYILDMFDADGTRVLDVGCGPGELLVELLDRGCMVSGADISAGMLELARSRTASHPGRDSLDLRITDLESLDYACGAFDAVICAGVIEYLDTDTAALAEINRVLAPGGRLIISVRNRACPARVWDVLDDGLKQTRLGRAFMTAVKRLRTGDANAKIVFTPYRKHTPWGFDRRLRDAGFEKMDFRYFHFYPFFAPLERLLPGLFIRAGMTLERCNHSAFSWLIAAGYIIKARKREPRPRVPAGDPSADGETVRLR
jgi:SAM-dependent methyltransferase